MAAMKAAAAERLAANKGRARSWLGPASGIRAVADHFLVDQLPVGWDGPCANRKSHAERLQRELGLKPTSYATVKRRLSGYAKPPWRRALAAASARRARLGPASLALRDVSTPYFETGASDGTREPGFSKGRRLEHQITLGLLTDATGFTLTVEAFEGNKAQTATMSPVVNAFEAAHHRRDVTVPADSGMISEVNPFALQAAGLFYILGIRITFASDGVREWLSRHPGETIPDGLVLTHPWPATRACLTIVSGVVPEA